MTLHYLRLGRGRAGRETARGGAEASLLQLHRYAQTTHKQLMSGRHGGGGTSRVGISVREGGVQKVQKSVERVMLKCCLLAARWEHAPRTRRTGPTRRAAGRCPRPLQAQRLPHTHTGLSQHRHVWHPNPDAGPKLALCAPAASLLSSARCRQCVGSSHSPGCLSSHAGHGARPQVWLQ